MCPGSVCYILNRVSAEDVGIISDAPKRNVIIEGEDISKQTERDAVPSGCSLLIRVQRDWCQIIKTSPRPRAWLSTYAWIGPLSAAGWSESVGCSFGSILMHLFVLLHAIRAPLNDQDQPGSSSQCFACP